MLSAATLAPKPGIQMMIDFAPKSQALGCRGRTSPFSTASREAAPKSNKDDTHHNLRCNTIQLRCNTGLDVKICRLRGGYGTTSRPETPYTIRVGSTQPDARSDINWTAQPVMRRLSLQLLLINPDIGTQRVIAFRLVGKSAIRRRALTPQPLVCG